MKGFWTFLKKFAVSLLCVLLPGCDNPINWDSPAVYVDPEALDTGLPIVRINTAGGQNITSKTDYIGAAISIDATGSDSLPETAAEVRGRGNATWKYYGKKPYRIKFSEKQKLFGLTKAKSWVLLANAADDTLMKNILAFELGQKLGLPFTNHYIPVELVLNGEYRGSYLLTEQVQTGKGRVDIDEDNGWLVELDTTYDEEPKFRTNAIPLPVMIKTPETILNGTADNFVKRDINHFLDLLLADSFPENGYRDVIDMDTFVKYILVQEFIQNTEILALRSQYMYKDSGSQAKICLGPLWDFDSTMEGSPNERFPDSGKDYTRLGEIFFGRFFKDPVFLAQYKEEWDAHKAEISAMADTGGFIDAMKEKLSASYEKDYYLWNGKPPAANAYADRIETLKTWWSARAAAYIEGVTP